MATMMAILSKAQFEEEFPSANVGDVLPIREYRSLHKSLDKLAEGGSLFLVTVRPSDEQLWLVGVLDRPKKGATGWKASANRQAIRLVARDRLKLENGKGLSAKKGALGMSLQTPRALADDDVAYLRDGAVPAVPTFSREQLQLETWRTLPRTTRDEIATAIAAAKGLEVVAHEDGEGQASVRFRHSSGIELALIPGGRFAMGLRDDEQARLLAFLREEEDTTGAIEMLENPEPLRPVHEVDVAPFLLAVTTSDDDFDADELSSVTKKLAKLGFRLPSEAEWEYACRGGFDGAFAHGDEIPSSTSPEPNGFGLHAMGSQLEVCADGYHPSYKGAPSTSEPWKGKGRVTRGGAEPLCWDGDRVWMLALAAARASLDPDDVCVSARPAMSLFDNYARETPVRMLPAKRAYRAKVQPEVKAAPVVAVAQSPREGLAQQIAAKVAPIRKVADGKIRSATFRNGAIDEININKLDADAIDAIAKLTKLRAIEVTGDGVKLRDLAPLLASHRIDSLSLSNAKADDLVALLSTPGVVLRSLSLGSLAADDVIRVMKTPGAATLEALALRSVVGLHAAAADAIAAHPLTDLTLILADAKASAFPVLAKMTSLRSLVLRANEELPADGCRALGKLASRLTRLWINDAVPADVIAALIETQPGLEDVTLPALVPAKLAPIVRALKAPRKLTFNFGNHHEHLGPDGAKRLLESAWGSVESLDLSSCGLGDEGAKAIADWPDTLSTLDLSNNGITAKGAELIAKGRGLRGLRALRIVMNPIGSGGATALAAASFASELRDLNLFSNRIGAPGLRSLINAMPKLEKLNLGSENSYKDEGLKLAVAGALPNVRDLAIEGVTSEAVEAWVASGHAARLERLFIGNSTLSRRAAEAIAKLPSLIHVVLNFVLPAETGALEPIFKRWWSSLTVPRPL